jgi:hypothetical protein
MSAGAAPITYFAAQVRRASIYAIGLRCRSVSSIKRIYLCFFGIKRHCSRSVISSLTI